MPQILTNNLSSELYKMNFKNMGHIKLRRMSCRRLIWTDFVLKGRLCLQYICSKTLSDEGSIFPLNFIYILKCILNLIEIPGPNLYYPFTQSYHNLSQSPFYLLHVLLLYTKFNMYLAPLQAANKWLCRNTRCTISFCLSFSPRVMNRWWAAARFAEPIIIALVHNSC